MAEPSLSLMKTHFDKLKSILNPSQNPSFPFASEAYELITNAWSVLSNPDEKSKHSQGLGDSSCKSSGSDSDCSGNVDTFWTICPYCYHVYEYLKLYEGCCLRCQFEKCGKAFHGVPLGQPPPEEVVEKGKYNCSGFVVLSFEKEVGGKWSPFSSLGSFPCGKTYEEEKKGTENVSIEISDEEMDDLQDMGKEKQPFESNVETMEVDCGFKIEEKNMMGKVEIGGEKTVGEVQNKQRCGGKIITGKRIKKSVPITLRKIMGKGIRVNRDEVLPMQGVENLGCDGGGDDMSKLNLETEIGGLEFNIRDDDIFVLLQDVVVPTV